jgi:hypothetical protein
MSSVFFRLGALIPRFLAFSFISAIDIGLTIVVTGVMSFSYHCVVNLDLCPRGFLASHGMREQVYLHTYVGSFAFLHYRLCNKQANRLKNRRNSPD